MKNEKNLRRDVRSWFRKFFDRFLERGLIRRTRNIIISGNNYKFRIIPTFCEHPITFEIIEIDKTFPIGGAQIAQENMTNVKIFLHKSCNPARLYKIISEELLERRKSLIAEKHALRDLKILISKNNLPVVAVKKSTEKEDVLGTDIILITKEGERIKVQVKSGIYNQKRHKNKYPEIFSFVYDNKLLKDGLLEKIVKIFVTSFRKKHQEHLNRENLTNGS